MNRILVWDIPTRLFHWLLVIAFAVAYITSGSDPWLSVHIYSGYVMLGLIAFRVVWGLIGGYYSRFTSFIYGPKALLTYLRETLAHSDKHYLGHNPIGSVAVYMLLLLGVFVSVSGVLAQGGEEQQGIAAGLLGIPAGAFVREVHDVASNLMVALVFAHIIGVLVASKLHHENLPQAIVTGYKPDQAGSVRTRANWPVGAAMLVAIGAFGVYWFAYALHDPIAKLSGLPHPEGEAPRVAFVGRTLPDDPTWREECGSCHLAFHPNLLPSRSWKRIMAEQATHFGSDLALDPATSDQVLAFLVANSADGNTTEAAYKINQSLAADAVPLRITETPYWKAKHHEITDAQWLLPKVKSRTNCAGCHVDAEAGTFEDSAMRIPR